MKKQTLLFLFLLISLLAGCAAMDHGFTQTSKIVTRNDQGQDTRCDVSNEEGHWRNIKPGEAFVLHRDGNPAVANCQSSTQHGTGSDDPEFKTRFLIQDLILDACIISCWVDGIGNAFFDYSGLIIVPMTP
ncbi:hypothetical protein ACQE3E_06520 [Methylomonas sp. MED-D]|uniref:hypothetical protein n=1 Tax=Methylomonas sp. MED-D TaxID=3418768 RepID=UPI003D0206A7